MFERIFGLGFVVVMVAGCAVDATQEQEEPMGETSQEIVGGQLASAYEEAALVNGQGFICSGAIIAPRVALTAGHCVKGSSFTVKTPYAQNQSARGRRVWTDYVNMASTVNPNTLDVGVIILDTPIHLSKYPKLSSAAVADGTKVINVGRIKDGVTSNTNLYFGREDAVRDAAPSFRFAYRGSPIVQSGDSGGPAYAGTGANRTIVAVNSGVSPSFQVLARVDLAYEKIQDLIAQNP
ncbi:MAG: trypsin-like serine protease [Labilithrix sp.]|nr:trypsin-like serine protease [Labilithrix sp.]MCW5809850.1 trypsin-like serine protease [Labilithrix sp.]